MNSDYDACRSLYRDAWLEERSSPTDRQAVRLALATAVAAGVHAAAAGASAASVAAVASTGGAGIQVGAAAMSTVGTKGMLQLILGGKFLSGLLVGAVIGTAGLATAVVVRPNAPTAVVKEPPTELLPNVPSRLNRERTLQTSQPLPVQLLRDAQPTPVAAPASGPRLPIQAGETSAPMPHQLTEESQALANVQDALSRGKSELALAMLEAQTRQFASGQLGEERSAARVLALCAAGRNVEAETARNNFISTHPNSALTKRINLGCNPR